MNAHINSLVRLIENASAGHLSTENQEFASALLSKIGNAQNDERTDIQDAANVLAELLQDA